MTDLTQVVDRYAEIHAEISKLTELTELTEQANALKAELIASGEKQIKGTFVKASVTVSAPRVTTDYKGLVAELNPPPELVQAWTTVGNPSTSIRLYGL